MSLNDAWKAHVAKWSNCQACPLAEHRNRVVLARGEIPCDVLFIAEAPGKSENLLGKPLVGPAGKMLDQIVESVWESMDCSYTRCYTNIVGCFPKEAKETEDHRPPKKAIKECSPRVKEMVAMCQPKLIVCVGSLSKEWLHLSVDMASEAHEIVHIAHPSAILQTPVPNRPLMIKKVVAVLQNALYKMGGGK